MEQVSISILDMLRKYIPCEVCGNEDEKKFEVKGGIENGFVLPIYVKCCECNEKYEVRK